MDNIQCTEQFIPAEWIVGKYELYKTMIFRISYSYLGNRQDCEDIMQDVFIKLCYNAPAFLTEEDEKRWLIRITINLCKNHLKSYWRRNIRNLDELGDAYDYAQEHKDDIMLDVLRLPEKYKIVIQLHYFSGYKIKEISDFLKVSEGAVKMRLKRARKLLKIEMED